MKTMFETSNNSLLTKEESTNIKGLLILLIVLGHNMFLNQSMVDGTYLPHRRYLYLFHVSCFFVLPILYGYPFRFGRNASSENFLYDIKAAFVRTLIPYLWFCSLFVCYQIAAGGANPLGIIYAIVIGEQTIHAEYLNEHFLWFLPAMFGLLFWKSIYYNVNKKIRIILLVSSLIIFILVTTMLVKKIPVMSILPFSLMRGLYYLSWGILVRHLIEYKFHEKTKMVLGGVILCTLIFAIKENWPKWTYFDDNVPLTAFMTILVSLILYRYRGIINNWAFTICGKYSLYIYLYNVLVYNIINRILLIFFPHSYVLGFASYVLTLLTCIGLSWITEFLTPIKKIVFPSFK